MFALDIPGFGTLAIEDLVMDYNGTLAEDGILIKDVGDILTLLSTRMTLHIITADTFGLAASQLKSVPCKLEIMRQADQITGKKKYIEKIGSSRVASIGNGRNDSLMLKHSALGIAVIHREGAAAETIMNADVLCRNIHDALDLFSNPDRLKATLRS
ncbi:HAD family hydrolase [Desulfobacterota bacterium M19]